MKRLSNEQIRAASLEAGMQKHFMGFHSGFITFARAIEAEVLRLNGIGDGGGEWNSGVPPLYPQRKHGDSFTVTTIGTPPQQEQAEERPKPILHINKEGAVFSTVDDEKSLTLLADAARQIRERNDFPQEQAAPESPWIRCGCGSSWPCAKHPDKAAPGAVQDGFVMVPREPNSDMLDRAVAFALNVQLSGEYGWSEYMRDLWGRMLSAAPKQGIGA